MTSGLILSTGQDFVFYYLTTCMHSLDKQSLFSCTYLLCQNIFLCAFCDVFSTSGAFVREGHAYFKTQVIKDTEERLTSVWRDVTVRSVSMSAFYVISNLEPIEDRSTGINCIISKVNIGSLAVPFEQ